MHSYRALTLVSTFLVNKDTRKKRFLHFLPSDLDRGPQIAPLVTHICTKLEVSMGFLFRENWTQKTDRETWCNAPP